MYGAAVYDPESSSPLNVRNDVETCSTHYYRTIYKVFCNKRNDDDDDEYLLEA